MAKVAPCPLPNHCGLVRAPHVEKQKWSGIPNCLNYSDRVMVYTQFTYLAPGRAFETCGQIQHCVVTTYSPICTYFLLSLPTLLYLHTNTQQGRVSGRHWGSTPKSVTVPHLIHKNSLADNHCGGTLYMCVSVKCKSAALIHVTLAVLRKPLSLIYSDTSANDDNSFRNHIR